MKIQTQLAFHISLSFIIFLSIFITKNYWNEVASSWVLYSQNSLDASEISLSSKPINKVILYAILLLASINLIISLIILLVKTNIQKSRFYIYFSFLAIGALIFTFLLPFNLENSVYQDIYFTEPIDKETIENSMFISLILQSRYFYLSLILQMLGIVIWVFSLIKIKIIPKQKLN